MSGYVQRQTKAIQAAVNQSETMMKKHESLMQDYAKNYEKIVRERNEAARERLEKRVEQAIQEEIERTEFVDKSKWASAYNVASKRIGESCSICLNDLQNGKPLMLTSCGHLFHATCITSFEAFSVKDKVSCPNCRHSYERTPLVKHLLNQIHS